MGKDSTSECIVISSSSESEGESDLYDFSQKWKRKPFPNVDVSKDRIPSPLKTLPTFGCNRPTKCAIVTPLPRPAVVDSPKWVKREDSIDKIVDTLRKEFGNKNKKAKCKKKMCRASNKSSHKKKVNSSMESCNSPRKLRTRSSSSVSISSPYAGSEEKRKKLGLRSMVKPATPVKHSNKTAKRCRRILDTTTESESEPHKCTPTLKKKAKKKNKLSLTSLTGLGIGMDCSIETENECDNSFEGEESKQLSQDVLTNKRANLQKVKRHELSLEDVCLSCGTTDNIKAKHPLFVGGLCADHHSMFQEWYFQKDQDGYQAYCAICCMGCQVILCDKPGCRRCYCSDCIDLLVGAKQYEKVSALKQWLCYLCSERTGLRDSLLKTRSNWQDNLQNFYQSTKETASKYPIAPVPKFLSPRKRKPIRVLSLFDGIATGLVALKELGLEIGKFVASEIDEDAIRLVQNRHSEVVHIGDVTKLTDADVKKLGPFDLVMGGSPCNDLSGANPRRKGLLDPEGSGCLFFDFYRVLRAAQPSPSPAGCNCDVTGQGSRPFFWLFENVVSMKLVERHRISRFLQCEPVSANAQHVSAAARPRLFWGNIPGLQKLRLNPSRGDRLTVQDCLEPGRVAVVDKLKTITTKPSCLYAGSNRQPAVKHSGKDDTLWSTEVERIFGVPEHYTDVNNLGPKERLALLGRSWSVPVIRHILAPLTDYFKHK
uniref:DNA (cytosine-5-)-methyltransferase n=1 Tax=Phallusia mammillata TaxID=59560 RepID=A0A6F9DBU3_9ASCI|nr:DNA (cytosine-5)-methyltransferase 3A-like [Phallusia mammillata]